MKEGKKNATKVVEKKVEEEEEEAIRATGVWRAIFGVIESFVGTTKQYL